MSDKAIRALDAQELDYIERRHTKGIRLCGDCFAPWPCEVAQLLATIRLRDEVLKEVSHVAYGA